MEGFKMILQTATRFVELDFCCSGYGKEAVQISTKPFPFPGMRQPTIYKYNVHSKHAAIIGLGEKYMELAPF